MQETIGERRGTIQSEKDKQQVNTPDPRTRRSIASDIFLEKQYFHPTNSSDPARYIFRIISKTCRDIHWEIDTTGSDNFQPIDTNGKPTDKKVFKSTIPGAISEKETDLLIVKLQQGWKLKFKFNFTLSNPSEDVQKSFILSDQQNKEKTFQNLMRLVDRPFSLMSIKEIEDEVRLTGEKYFDLDFPPRDTSVFETNIDARFDVVVHWRRPEEFLHANYELGTLKCVVFQDSCEPSDIKPGILRNEWFLSALAILAERPELVERLFVKQQINTSGVYKIKICKNGLWQTVTIDDLFPCFPMGPPIFSAAYSNEIWVLLMEKAYAKIHGSYYQLRGGIVNEALLDLTGCPSTSYDMQDEFVKNFISNGKFWDLLVYFQEQHYLLSFSSESEGRWKSQACMVSKQKGDKASKRNQPLADDINKLKKDLIPLNQAFAVLHVTEKMGHRLIKLRSSLTTVNWTGDWSLPNSPLWSKNLKQAIGEQHFSTDDPASKEENNDNSTFWMSEQEASTQFRTLNVCRVRNWNEIRVKGKFVRVQDAENASILAVLSKSYYSFDVIESQNKVFITLHQEDERIKGVDLKRSYLDVGIALLRRTQNGVELMDLKDFIQDRQVELEVNLDPGSYIIVPRTTGCQMSHICTPQNDKQQNRPKLVVPTESEDAISRKITYIPSTVINKTRTLSIMFDQTVIDIFNKFDVRNLQVLCYPEFKALCDVVGKQMSEELFFDKIVTRYQSHLIELKENGKVKEQYGLTIDGLKMFFLGYIEEAHGLEDKMYEWLENLGYDSELNSVRSRLFVLSLHSIEPINLKILDALQTDIDTQTNLLIVEKFGQLKIKKAEYEILYTFSEQIVGVSYFVTNKLQEPIEMTLDFSQTLNLTSSQRNGIIKKRIEPCSTEFMIHARIQSVRDLVLKEHFQRIK